jgi:hypothetical protein
VIAKETDHEISKDLHVFSHPDYEQVVLGMPSVYVCRDRLMCTSLTPKRLGEFYPYSVFKGLSIVGRFRVNLNIPPPKISGIQTGAKTQNYYFLENVSNYFVQSSVMYGDHILT